MTRDNSDTDNSADDDDDNFNDDYFGKEMCFKNFCFCGNFLMSWVLFKDGDECPGLSAYLDGKK